MIFRKYNQRKRSSIIICMPDCEGATTIKMDKENQIRVTLETRYKELIIDSPPYNYVVYSGGYFELKPPDIAHSDNSYLSAYNDDIKILLLEKQFLKTKKEDIVQIIADVSVRYSMCIKESLAVMTLEDEVETTGLIDAIMRDAIQLRNSLRPVMSIKETIIDNDIIINDKIISYDNRDGASNLGSIASRFSIPLSVLESLNPHINTNKLPINETIFLPSVATIAAIKEAGSIVKKATYLYDLCEDIVKKGLKIDG